MSTEQGIKVENLVKEFGKGDSLLRVIDGGSFTVNKGELIALVAPSGAGKTTLLMMIGCAINPTSGSIWLGDEKVYENKWITHNSRKIRREKIGFIFQAHYLIPFLNVIENVTLVPQTNGVSEKQAKADAMKLLEYLDIADKAYHKPSRLSGGQNQRVAIARALANNPQIILADEPTAALDSARALSVVQMLKKIATEQNVAVIMVTHDERMVQCCDKIMKIENKKIVFEAVETHSQHSFKTL